MDIKQMKNGDLWFGTSMGGISILNMQSNTFTDARNIRFRNITATNDEYGLTGPYVRRMLQDSFGNIWIAITVTDWTSSAMNQAFSVPCAIQRKNKGKPATNKCGASV